MCVRVFFFLINIPVLFFFSYDMITYNHIHKPSMCELARPAGPRRRASIMDSTLYFMSLTHPSRCDWAYTDALHRPTHTTDARVSVRYRHSTTWIITVHAARRRPDMTQRQTQCPTKVLCFTFQHYFRRLHHTPYTQFIPNSKHPCVAVHAYIILYGPCLYEREMNWGTAL